jgi:hypothetical protein
MSPLSKSFIFLNQPLEYYRIIATIATIIQDYGLSAENFICKYNVLQCRDGSAVSGKEERGDRRSYFSESVKEHYGFSG